MLINTIINTINTTNINNKGVVSQNKRFAKREGYFKKKTD